MSDLLTIREVADLFRVSASTIQDQRRRGVPPGSLGIRMEGRRVRWRREDLDAWVDEQIRQHNAASPLISPTRNDQRGRR